MDRTEQLEALRREAKEIGLFLPVQDDVSPIAGQTVLHGKTLASRAALLMQPVYDADEQGAPTEKTVQRYCDAVRARCCGLVWTEPVAFTPDSRRDPNQLMLTPENKGKFMSMLYEIRQAAKAAHGTAPVFVLLLDHAARNALTPVTMEQSSVLPTEAPVITDDALLHLIVDCGAAAEIAEQAGFEGIALNAADRSLFGESLAAFHREGMFGGDFDDRTRFVRDCYTAMNVGAKNVFFSIALTLSDGIPQPDGWGMAFETESHPDLYEPALLTKILRELYGVQLVCCTVGIPGVNWMQAEEPERESIRVSRLCTCIAMLDSDRQQNVDLIVPQTDAASVPFDCLAAGMIAGEFASFAGFAG